MKGESAWSSCLLESIVKDVEARNKVLKSVHEGAGETIQSKSMGGHVGRDKTIQKFSGGCQYVVAKDEIDARQFVKTCAQC